MVSRLAALLAAVIAAALWSPPDAALATTRVVTSGASVRSDFDGDGFADLAVGVPGEGVGGVADAGTVNVLYGAPSGLTARDQVWSQNSPGIKGAAEADDQFGFSVTSR